MGGRGGMEGESAIFGGGERYVSERQVEGNSGEPGALSERGQTWVDL